MWSLLILKLKNIIQNIGVGEYSVPKSVYAISIPDENLAAMVELSELDNSSKDLKTFLIQKVLGSLMIQINGMAGAENLAASSVCTVGKTFVDENATGDVIYLYTYENALPVAVTFTIGENHAVSATGVFIMYDGFTCGSADEIKSFSAIFSLRYRRFCQRNDSLTNYDFVYRNDLPDAERIIETDKKLIAKFNLQNGQ